jgi:type IV pilus assembly protein PilC
MPTFNYEAQTPGGFALSGSLDAPDQIAAQQILASLQLRVTAIAQDASAKSRRARPLSAADFQAFNIQLAHLTASGLPLERGLRIIAAEIGSGSVAAATTAIADELDRGLSLPDAIARNQNRFPPVYGRLLSAGIATANLPAMLLSMSRHLQLLSSLRAAMSRAMLYPYVVFIAFLLLTIFVSLEVIPSFKEIFRDFRTNLPGLTEFILNASLPIALISMGLVAIAVLVPILLSIMAASGVHFNVLRLIAWVPLVRPAINYSEIARWSDALNAGVEAGIPLTTALEIARDSVEGARLRADTQRLIELVSAGWRMNGNLVLDVLPMSLVTSIQVGVEHNDLTRVLRSMTDMYFQKARDRANFIPAFYTPIFMAILTALIATVIFAMFLPLIKLIQSVTGGE